MRVAMDFSAIRGAFRIYCKAEMGKGTHLVSGSVGSGKSTMALVMASLIPYEGTLDLDGISSVVLSLQFPEYHITGSTLEEEARSWGLDPAEVLADAELEPFGKSDPFRLSRGQLKRFNLSCVFLLDPDLLLLDEPFSSLDCQVKAKICEYIEAREEKMTVIFSHERSVLPRVDTLSNIQEGMLDFCGSVPDAISLWKGAPPYLKKVLEMGKLPKNIRLKDALEALCRTQG
ncbi:MAG: energy-coupling factor transport system ATP-binding protein [Candidatus Methanomethylophilaceae archaeon]|nr:energy-coupling factor transport system ATP-binding protein [Candidatus Methanomethylophilaceae archaeon]